MKARRLSQKWHAITGGIDRTAWDDVFNASRLRDRQVRDLIIPLALMVLLLHVMEIGGRRLLLFAAAQARLRKSGAEPRRPARVPPTEDAPPVATAPAPSPAATPAPTQRPAVSPLARAKARSRGRTNVMTKKLSTKLRTRLQAKLPSSAGGRVAADKKKREATLDVRTGVVWSGTVRSDITPPAVSFHFLIASTSSSRRELSQTRLRDRGN